MNDDWRSSLGFEYDLVICQGRTYLVATSEVKTKKGHRRCRAGRALLRIVRAVARIARAQFDALRRDRGNGSGPFRGCDRSGCRVRMATRIRSTLQRAYVGDPSGRRASSVRESGESLRESYRPGGPQRPAWGASRRSIDSAGSAGRASTGVTTQRQFRRPGWPMVCKRTSAAATSQETETSTDHSEAAQMSL